MAERKQTQQLPLAVALVCLLIGVVLGWTLRPVFDQGSGGAEPQGIVQNDKRDVEQGDKGYVEPDGSKGNGQSDSQGTDQSGTDAKQEGADTQQNSGNQGNSQNNSGSQNNGGQNNGGSQNNSQSSDAKQNSSGSKTGTTSWDDLIWDGDDKVTDPNTGATVEFDGEYTSKDEVALYIYAFDDVPSNFVTKTRARNAGWVSSEGNLWDVLPGKSIGGGGFDNIEGELPLEYDPERTFKECDINYEGGYRGSERLVWSDDGYIFYTGDHYETFTLLYSPEE